LAGKSGVLDDHSFTKKFFLDEIDDLEKAIKPAYTEHKIELGHGVYGTPKNMIDEKLVPDTESGWGPTEWEEKLQKVKKRPPKE
jgi:hypothetical protein